MYKNIDELNKILDELLLNTENECVEFKKAENNFDIDILKQLLIEKFTQINYTEAKEDVLPFIKNNNSLTLWNSDFFISITNDLKGVS